MQIIQSIEQINNQQKGPALWMKQLCDSCAALADYCDERVDHCPKIKETREIAKDFSRFLLK